MVPVIRKILFTTNLSKASRDAFQYAAAMATRHAADLVLLHVREELSMGIAQQLSGLFGEEKWKQLQSQHERSARELIIGKASEHEMIHRALSSIPAIMIPETDQGSFGSHEVVIKQGDVVDQIIDVAAATGCDLIVIGAHTDLLGMPKIGTTARGVVHRAAVPVLITPAHEAAP